MEHIQELNPMSFAMTRVAQGKQTFPYQPMEESSTLRTAKGSFPEDIQVGFVEELATPSSPLPSIDEVGSPFTHTTFSAYEQMSTPLLPARGLSWH